jgi:hypothetical protein
VINVTVPVSDPVDDPVFRVAGCPGDAAGSDCVPGGDSSPHAATHNRTANPSMRKRFILQYIPDLLNTAPCNLANYTRIVDV